MTNYVAFLVDGRVRLHLHPALGAVGLALDRRQPGPGAGAALPAGHAAARVHGDGAAAAARRRWWCWWPSSWHRRAAHAQLAAGRAGAGPADGVQQRARAGPRPGRQPGPGHGAADAVRAAHLEYASGVFSVLENVARTAPTPVRILLEANPAAVYIELVRCALMASHPVPHPRVGAGRGLGRGRVRRGVRLLLAGRGAVRPWLRRDDVRRGRARDAGGRAGADRRRGRPARGLPGRTARGAGGQRRRGPAAAGAGPSPPARQREVHAVRGVSFTAYRGEAIGVIGSNGSGKSTLLRAVAGLLPPATGAVYTARPADPAGGQRGPDGLRSPASATSCWAASRWG